MSPVTYRSHTALNDASFEIPRHITYALVGGQRAGSHVQSDMVFPARAGRYAGWET